MLTIPGGSGKELVELVDDDVCKEATRKVGDSCHKMQKMDRYPEWFFHTLTDAELHRWLVGYQPPEHPNTDAYYRCLLTGHETLRQFGACP